jgi:hypothetical protein
MASKAVVSVREARERTIATLSEPAPRGRLAERGEG